MTDYLEGDVYFKTHREGQNLDRCRTQLKLVADMEKKWDIMNNIVKNTYSFKYKNLSYAMLAGSLNNRQSVITTYK